MIKTNNACIFIQEKWVNATESHGIGESEVYETSYTVSEKKALFQSLQREYGRCISAMYLERTSKPDIAIGWVFQQRMQYEDSQETYIRETWISLHSAPPTTTVNHHYLGDT